MALIRANKSLGNEMEYVTESNSSQGKIIIGQTYTFTTGSNNKAAFLLYGKAKSITMTMNTSVYVVRRTASGLTTTVENAGPLMTNPEEIIMFYCTSSTSQNYSFTVNS